MLENVKVLLDIEGDEKDRLIELLISQAIDEAKDYTHKKEVYEMQSVIEKMVVFNYNRLGTEGLKSESYSGESYSYSSEYPESIMRVLKKYRKLIVL